MLSRFNEDFFKDLDFWLDVPKGGSVARYPLTDISYDKEIGDVKVEIACAGFGKDDLDIELVGNTLVITGAKEEVQEDKDTEYVQRHISTKSFERKVKLHQDYVGGEVQAEYKDGLLTIKVKRQEQPKQLIEIKG
jgi:HSP20 family molecular chaperone IbpA